MPRLDRGPSYGGYYITDPATPHNLFGMRFENSWPCGTFIQDGITRGITFFYFLKNLHPTEADDQQHAESFDVGVTCYDAYKSNPTHILNRLMKDEDITPVLPELKPIPRGLVDKDLKEGKDGEEIIEARAGILVGEFLGFTLDQVKMFFPETWQPTTDENGNEIPNITKCSLEMA